MIKIQKFSCSAGQWYFVRTRDTIRSVTVDAEDAILKDARRTYVSRRGYCVYLEESKVVRRNGGRRFEEGSKMVVRPVLGGFEVKSAVRGEVVLISSSHSSIVALAFQSFNPQYLVSQISQLL